MLCIKINGEKIKFLNQLIMSKKILITGAAGFIGSHLAELCVQKGYNVTAFDIYNSENSCGWLENSKYKKDINIVLGDIRDYNSVNKVVKNKDIVFHLAALIGIPYSYSSPLSYLKTNVDGAYNILENSKRSNIEQLIMTSTSEVYGSAQYSPIDEKHPLVGQSPYSASKIAADQLAISYFRSFKLPVKILRPFNTYGPRQSQRAIIPTIISQCLNSNIIRLGNLKPKRDFLYVSDTCQAFLNIVRTKNFFGEVFNVGSAQDISINDLVQNIKKLTNTNLQVKIEKKRIRPSSSEVGRLICNSKKIRKNLKWKKRVEFDEGLKKTIEWFIKFNQSKNSEKYSI